MVRVVEHHRVADAHETPTERRAQVLLGEHVLGTTEGHEPGGQQQHQFTRPASSKLWVVVITVRPAACSSSTTDMMIDRERTSSPVSGSSRSRMGASWARPWATKARWRWPPDRWWIWRPARSSISRRRIAESTASRSDGTRSAEQPEPRIAGHRHDVAHRERHTRVDVGRLQHDRGGCAERVAAARRRFDDTTDELEQRRLARAVRPDDRHRRSGRNLERQIADRVDRAVVDMHVVEGHCSRHARTISRMSPKTVDDR